MHRALKIWSLLCEQVEGKLRDQSMEKGKAKSSA